MKSYSTLALSLLLLLLTFSTQAAIDGQEYKDWKISCNKPQNQKDAKESCHVFQNLVAKDGDRRVLHIAIGFVPKRKEPAAILTLPLGISLPPGIAIKVDENKARQITVEACFPSGCQAGFPVDDELLQQFKAGKTLHVIFSDLNRQLISVPVSLSGFSAGIKAAANHKGK
ncbi:MAG: invasion associated locus B family protein [Gammaproteobacteria bacterium]|nr:MAG: invasion associated locus B family protein [Gammaproteobacteria bacterium]